MWCFSALRYVHCDHPNFGGVDGTLGLDGTLVNYVSLLIDFAVCAGQGRNRGSTGAKPTLGDARWPVETVAATGG